MTFDEFCNIAFAGSIANASARRIMEVRNILMRRAPCAFTAGALEMIKDELRFRREVRRLAA